MTLHSILTRRTWRLGHIESSSELRKRVDKIFRKPGTQLTSATPLAHRHSRCRASEQSHHILLAHELHQRQASCNVIIIIILSFCTAAWDLTPCSTAGKVGIAEHIWRLAKSRPDITLQPDHYAAYIRSVIGRGGRNMMAVRS